MEPTSEAWEAFILVPVALKSQMAHWPGVSHQVSLLNELQVQGDAHAIDEDDALIKKLLVRDFGVHELLDRGARTNEFDGFGSAFGAGREFVEDGKVEELEFHVRGNPVG